MERDIEFSSNADGHPEGPRFCQRAEGSLTKRYSRLAGDPSLRLKNGSVQDDSARIFIFNLLFSIFLRKPDCYFNPDCVACTAHPPVPEVPQV